MIKTDVEMSENAMNLWWSFWYEKKNVMVILCQSTVLLWRVPHKGWRKILSWDYTRISGWDIILVLHCYLFVCETVKKHWVVIKRKLLRRLKIVPWCRTKRNTVIIPRTRGDMMKLLKVVIKEFQDWHSQSIYQAGTVIARSIIKPNLLLP